MGSVPWGVRRIMPCRTLCCIADTLLPTSGSQSGRKMRRRTSSSVSMALLHSKDPLGAGFEPAHPSLWRGGCRPASGYTCVDPSGPVETTDSNRDPLAPPGKPKAPVVVECSSMTELRPRM